MVLYHIISCYQLLCAVLHRMVYHPDDKSILLVPDFYLNKDPDIRNIQGKFFDEVFLFPYMEIPHNKRTISHDTVRCYEKTVKYPITDFSEIVTGGVHFYFTDLLIANKIHFDCFEEAAGLYSSPEVLVKNVGLKFPVQKKWAQKNKLFDCSNKLIDKVYCCLRIQSKAVKNSKAVDFDIMEILENLPEDKRTKIIDHFVKTRYPGTENAVIILTEQLANLGKMTVYEQEELYRGLAKTIPDDMAVYVKPHPDDGLEYENIFNNAVMINSVFPAELLPFIFERRPKYIKTVSSTCEKHLNRYFKILG